MSKKKTIKIVSKWDNKKILLYGKYESIKDCLEKNRGADLRGAYLRGADLKGADLRGAYLRGAYLRSADLKGADLRGAYLRSADLRGAYLRGADLRGAYLRSADLKGAYLRGAYLRSAKNYYDRHDFAIEIIRQQSIKTFTQKEWAFIGILATHRPCWNTILNKYKKEGLSIAKKLSKAGYGEYLERIKESKNEQR